MSFTAIENNPISVNLVEQVNTTGWSLPGDGTAVHTSCNSGFLTLLKYPVVAGRTYQISYTIISISGGFIVVEIGNNAGGDYSSPQTVVETLVADNTDPVKFFSNANCTITNFVIKDITVADGVTIVYSPGNKKWSDYRTYYPDMGWSLYTRTILAYNGDLYEQNNGTTDNTNNFFGVQNKSSIKLVEAKNPQLVKDFEALNYQANSLLVTTIDGVQTSLGQISTLIDTDFIKQKLESGGVEILSYEKDGVYSASFMGDENEDVVNGSSMRGNFMIVELIQDDGSVPLTLFSVAIRSRRVFLGPR